MGAHALSVRTLVMSLIMQFCREMGLKWEGERASSLLGKRTRKARLIRVRSRVPEKKSANTLRTSEEMQSQKVEKKLGPKPSGPGLEPLFMHARAQTISSCLNGEERESGRGERVGYREER
jgi:hypothetical protein